MTSSRSALSLSSSKPLVAFSRVRAEWIIYSSSSSRACILTGVAGNNGSLIIGFKVT